MSTSAASRRDPALTGWGMTTTQYFAHLPEGTIRGLMEPRFLSLLDALLGIPNGGRVPERELRQVAHLVCDLGEMLGDPGLRQCVVTHVPEVKRAELAERVGAPLAGAESWTPAQVGEARDFFGLITEVVAETPPAATSRIEPAYGLFDHQRSAVQRLMPLLWNDLRRAVLHLPTGVGKTRTAMHVVAESLRANEPSVVVWLASGRELLDQAVDSFENAWHHLGNRRVHVCRMWGDHTPDTDELRDGFLAVGLSKGWSAMSSIDPDWALRLARQVRLAVFDEAHQSIAPTYREITENLTIDYRCALLGLTATPGRTWADIDADGKLAEFYGYNKVGIEVPAENPIEYLITHGYLARPKFRTLFAEPGIHLDDTRSLAETGSLSEEVLAGLSEDARYVTAVVDALAQLVDAGHRRVLVFAASVAQARILTAVLLVRGLRAAAVTATTPAPERKREISDFKSRGPEPRVLINYGVLTTGFDAPQASAVLIARPTKSLVLYSQMVGRAIRGPKAGGTEICEIVTVVDPAVPGFGDVAEAFENWEDVWH
ncbi:MAG: DEAD/DEAH box helicase family protein [bacterium]|nr:DEAD/DEAH box helicase family protein [bacterium]